MKRKMENQLRLWLYCLIIGSFAGLVLWGFLKAVLVGTELIWEWGRGIFENSPSPFRLLMDIISWENSKDLIFEK